MRWYDGFVIAMSNPTFLITALGGSVVSLGGWGAIIVTPALSYAFLPNARSIARGHDGWLSRTLKARFARDLPRALDHPHLVMGVAVALLMVAAFAMSRMGTGFLPDFHEGSLTVQANTLPGTSLAKSDEIGRRV